MSDPAKIDQLQALDAKIAAAKKAHEPEPPKEEHYSMAQMGWRMVIELVVGLAIGFGMGYGLDRLFGTLPIFMVIFIGFGLAAGVKTMMRTAAEVQEKQLAIQAARNEGRNSGD